MNASGNDDIRAVVAEAVKGGDGILNLDPAWVARDWLPAGRRLGLTDAQYDVGARGTIAERWLASITHADNAIGPDDEGIGHIRYQGRRVNLAAAVAAAPELIMGTDYAASHPTLGRLAKIFDFGARIPYHIHPPLREAQRVGRNSKDEAYYLPPDLDMGPHPETFLGLHPSLDRATVGPALVEELERWDADTILRFSRAYQQLPEDGFFIPSGVLHAPGTALTIELQEDSDTLAMLQALNAGTIISKDLLFKDVSDEARHAHGEAALLDWIDWDENNDPYFYENHHTPPVPFCDEEAWIFYGSPKFSGKRLRLAPGARYTAGENGVFNLLVWQGEGTIGGVRVAAGALTGDFANDELLVTHERAVQPLEVVNTGDRDLLVIKMFGPDLNPDAPTIGRR